MVGILLKIILVLDWQVFCNAGGEVGGMKTSDDRAIVVKYI